MTDERISLLLGWQVLVGNRTGRSWACSVAAANGMGGFNGYQYLLKLPFFVMGVVGVVSENGK